MLASLRRLALLVLVAAAVTAGVSVLVGALLGASLNRALSLGFYSIGCVLMLGGFFTGNRGPTRVESEVSGSPISPFALFGARKIRWATRVEQEETINYSAVIVSLGFILLMIGLLVDTHQSLF
jgi:hypothetical protein